MGQKLSLQESLVQRCKDDCKSRSCCSSPRPSLGGDLSSPHAQQLTLLVGDPGTGKKTAMYRLYHQLAAAQPMARIPICLDASFPGTESEGGLFELAMEEVLSAAGGDPQITLSQVADGIGTAALLFFLPTAGSYDPLAVMEAVSTFMKQLEAAPFRWEVFAPLRWLPANAPAHYLVELKNYTSAMALSAVQTMAPSVVSDSGLEAVLGYLLRGGEAPPPHLPPVASLMETPQQVECLLSQACSPAGTMATRFSTLFSVARLLAGRGVSSCQLSRSRMCVPAYEYTRRLIARAPGPVSFDRAALEPSIHCNHICTVLKTREQTVEGEFCSPWIAIVLASDWLVHERPFRLPSLLASLLPRVGTCKHALLLVHLLVDALLEVPTTDWTELLQQIAACGDRRFRKLEVGAILVDIVNHLHSVHYPGRGAFLDIIIVPSEGFETRRRHEVVAKPLLLPPSGIHSWSPHPSTDFATIMATEPLTVILHVFYFSTDGEEELLASCSIDPDLPTEKVISLIPGLLSDEIFFDCDYMAAKKLFSGAWAPLSGKDLGEQVDRVLKQEPMRLGIRFLREHARPHLYFNRHGSIVRKFPQIKPTVQMQFDSLASRIVTSAECV